MIRVRVDWHEKCPGCGTELVSDFLGDSAWYPMCPWCGREGLNTGPDSPELRDYLYRSISEIEERANSVAV